jgi:hypothetical protein
MKALLPVVKYGFAAVAALILVFYAYHSYREITILRQESRERWELIQERLEAMEEAFTAAGEELAEGVDVIETGVAQIRGTVREKAAWDYGVEGLAHFRRQEYGIAYELFTRALRYEGSNRGILFYQLYSLYLERREWLSEAEGRRILAGIQELERRGYEGSERLDFSAEEMQAKAGEMIMVIESAGREENE